MQHLFPSHDPGGLNQNAGTDVTADLEEETHASEHESGGVDEVNILDINGGSIDGTPIGAASATDATFTDINVTGTITGNISATASTFTHLQVVNLGFHAPGDSTFTVIIPVTLMSVKVASPGETEPI